MKNKIGAIVVSVLIAAGLLFSTATYQVGEWQQAVVLKFGRPIRTVTEPGLHFKTPLVHNVVYFEKRLLGYDAAPRELLTRDKQQLVVDNFSRWEIVDPLKFYQTVITQAGAQSRLDDIIYSNLRQAIGQVTLREVVSGDRDALMRQVTSKSSERAA
ncbi:MAG: SPFH domain-containing protein, partial [Candidatus Binatia bacterium]